MKAIYNGTWTRVSKEFATDISPAGTIKFHYALDGTKEELDSYEEEKGEYFRTIEDGDNKGKPRWNTTTVPVKDDNGKYATLEVKMNKDGFLNVVETEEDIIEKATAVKQSKQDAKTLELQIKLGAKYGMSMFSK
jgi:hypothetical protein